MRTVPYFFFRPPPVSDTHRLLLALWCAACGRSSSLSTPSSPFRPGSAEPRRYASPFVFFTKSFLHFQKVWWHGICFLLDLDDGIIDGESLGQAWGWGWGEVASIFSPPPSFCFLLDCLWSRRSFGSGVCPDSRQWAHTLRISITGAGTPARLAPRARIHLCPRSMCK